MNTLAIGIDIGGTRTKIGLVRLGTGRVEQMLVAPTETTDGARFLERIGAAIATFQATAATEGAPLAGVGIGVPGFVRAGGVVDSTYGFLPFMEDYPLAKLVGDRHGLPCRLDNDARVVALGEALFGQGRGFGRVLTLTLGTGLGLGFVIDGQLDGPLPFAHMGGHLTVATTAGFVCYCGKTGCLESLVSSAGLGRITERRGWPWQHPELPPTAELLFDQHRAGNPAAEAIVAEYLGYLKTGIANYVNLYAPDIIVLGGGLARGLGGATARLHSPGLLAPFKAYQAGIVVSDLHEQAGILGSAALFR